MTRNLAALAIPAALVVLSGCGVAAVTTRTTTVSDVNANATIGDASPHVYLVPPPVPTAAPKPVPAPVPSPDVVRVLTAGATQYLEIVSHSGAVVAKTDDQPHRGHGWSTPARAARTGARAAPSTC